MAHICNNCGLKCHCGGDIDDLVLSQGYDCPCCDKDEDDWDDDYEEWREQNVPKTQ